MPKLLILAAAAALALGATAAQADCYSSHNVTASKAPAEQAVSMSTHDDVPAPPVADAEAGITDDAAAPVCAEGDKDCAVGTK